MAGTLTIGTLSDGTNSTSSTNAIMGSAKAWVKFVGSTATINASFNVSSVVRNGTGDYYVYFTNTMPDANYVTVVNACDTPTFNRMAGPEPAPTTARVRVCSSIVSGPTMYESTMNVAVFR